mmetsp:Transcript_32287/g.89183  ORF Transcript_32287/g.89183 Transcript_32287/m.89183 type:complete len:407 (+) Transcript_32287:169-1389(+)
MQLTSVFLLSLLRSGPRESSSAPPMLALAQPPASVQVLRGRFRVASSPWGGRISLSASSAKLLAAIDRAMAASLTAFARAAAAAASFLGSQLDRRRRTTLKYASLAPFPTRTASSCNGAEGCSADVDRSPSCGAADAGRVVDGEEAIALLAASATLRFMASFCSATFAACESFVASAWTDERRVCNQISVEETSAGESLMAFTSSCLAVTNFRAFRNATCASESARPTASTALRISSAGSVISFCSSSMKAAASLTLLMLVKACSDVLSDCLTIIPSFFVVMVALKSVSLFESASNCAWNSINLATLCWLGPSPKRLASMSLVATNVRAEDDKESAAPISTSHSLMVLDASSNGASSALMARPCTSTLVIACATASTFSSASRRNAWMIPRTFASLCKLLSPATRS